MSIVTKTSTNR